MAEPIWLTKSIVQAIHMSQLREHGGQYGVRDNNLLESALTRPMNRWAYDQESDILLLAAAYGYGLAKNHCFVDGNKRAAFMAMYTFLGLNGYEIHASEPSIVALMLGVADSSISEFELHKWLQQHSTPAK